MGYIEYTVWSLGGGWYDFKDLPSSQTAVVFFEERYCGTDKKAIKTARRRLRDKNAAIIIKPVHEQHSG